MDIFEKTRIAYFEALNGINVKENEQIILQSKNLNWSYYFAKDIKGADIKAHEKVLLELNKPNDSFWFARDIVGANIEEHFKVVYNSGDKHYLNRFIKEVNYKNTKVEEWLMYI